MRGPGGCGSQTLGRDGVAEVLLADDLLGLTLDVGSPQFGFISIGIKAGPGNVPPAFRICNCRSSSGDPRPGGSRWDGRVVDRASCRAASSSLALRARIA